MIKDVVIPKQQFDTGDIVYKFCDDKIYRFKVSRVELEIKQEIHYKDYFRYRYYLGTSREGGRMKSINYIYSDADELFNTKEEAHASIDSDVTDYRFY